MFGKDPQVTLEPRQKAAKELMLNDSMDHLNNGKSVVLDWGFWKQAEREIIRENLKVKVIKSNCGTLQQQSHS